MFHWVKGLTMETWQLVAVGERVRAPGVENVKLKLHSFGGEALPKLNNVMKIYTRFECSFTSFPLVSIVVSHLFHSFRV